MVCCLALCKTQMCPPFSFFLQPNLGWYSLRGLLPCVGIVHSHGCLFKITLAIPRDAGCANSESHACCGIIGIFLTKWQVPASHGSNDTEVPSSRRHEQNEP